MWNYSVENTTLWFLRLLYIHEIWLSWVEPHLFTKKCTSTKNLWIWPGSEKGSLLLLSSEAEVTRRQHGPTLNDRWPHRGNLDRHAGRRPHGEGGRAWASAAVKSKQQQGPWAAPRSEDRLQGPFSLKAFWGARAADPWVFTAASTTATKCMSVVFSSTACGTLLQRSGD